MSGKVELSGSGTGAGVRGVVAVTMAGLLMFCFGMAADGFTAYLPYLRQGYGIADAQVSLLVTLRCVTSFASALLAQAVYARISIRAGMAFSVATLAAGFAVCGLFPSYAGACVGSLLMGITCGMGSTVPASMLMHRWYGARVAVPLCICMAGSGLSSVVGVPLVVAGISTLGMEATFVAEGAVFAALALAMWLVVRDSPAVKPQALGDAAVQEAAHAHASRRVAASSSRDLLVLSFAVLLIGAVASPGPANYSLLLTEAGAPAASMASIVSVGGIALTLSKLAYGAVSRRFGTYRSNLLAFGLLACGMACSLLVGSLGAAAGIALVILCGLGFPPATAGPSLWAADLFPRDFDRSVQRLQVTYSLGTLVGMPVPGLVASLTGSYVPVYASYAVLVSFALVLIQSRYRKAGLAPAHRVTPAPASRAALEH